MAESYIGFAPTQVKVTGPRLSRARLGDFTSDDKCVEQCRRNGARLCRALPEPVRVPTLGAMDVKRISLSLLLLGLSLCPDTGAGAETSSELRRALLFHASFDHRLDADFAVGDPRLYTAPTGNRLQARAGLSESDLVVHARGEGRFGDALRFTRKMRPVVFFKGDKNLGYKTNEWSGALSCWLRLDPDKDLQPGYCDPLQFVAQAWDEGNMFLEFSKDHTPRHFRFAMQPQKKSWNPQNRGWEDFAENERPMIAVHQPPFRHDKWTHVVFCFGNVNTGDKDGWGRLYLDGKEQGAFTDWKLVFNWDESRSALTLGLSYIGWIDDVAVFKRPLSEAEVRTVHALRNGVRDLK